jgi:hypothetical protein
MGSKVNMLSPELALYYIKHNSLPSTVTAFLVFVPEGEKTIHEDETDQRNICGVL